MRGWLSLGAGGGRKMVRDTDLHQAVRTREGSF